MNLLDCKYLYFSTDCRTYEINIYDLLHKNIPLPKTNSFVAWEKTEKVKETFIKLQPV